MLIRALSDTVRATGYNDILVVSELGSGISRGSMNYGRLYQSRYIPPNRTDGLLPQCEDKERDKEENCEGEDTENFEKSSENFELD